MEVTRTARTWLGEDGILRTWQDPDLYQSGEDARANMSAAARVAGGKLHPLLVDLRGARQAATREARAAYAAEGHQYVCAAAVLIDNPVGRVIGNFFIGLNRPRLPMRLFVSEAEALAWLQTFLG